MGPPGDGGANHETVVNFDEKLAQLAVCRHYFMCLTCIIFGLQCHKSAHMHGRQTAKCSPTSEHVQSPSMQCMHTCKPTHAASLRSVHWPSWQCTVQPCTGIRTQMRATPYHAMAHTYITTITRCDRQNVQNKKLHQLWHQPVVSMRHCACDPCMRQRSSTILINFVN